MSNGIFKQKKIIDLVARVDTNTIATTPIIWSRFLHRLNFCSKCYGTVSYIA